MKYLEESLDVPLREVLRIMQKRTISQTRYFGVQALKCPLDFWVYQEIIHEVRPDLIIEIGNRFGGSTLAIAHILDHLGKGQVLGIDINHDQMREVVKRHPRISLITGDVCTCFPAVQERARGFQKTLIIEDSSHTYENTLRVLQTYGPLVTPGSYFIVEDSICHHGVDEGPNPGPYEAIEAFLKNNNDFELDRGRESFLITWNPKGYLRRK